MRTNRNALFKLRRFTAAAMAMLVMMTGSANVLSAEGSQDSGNDGETITEVIESPVSETTDVSKEENTSEDIQKTEDTVNKEEIKETGQKENTTETVSENKTDDKTAVEQEDAESSKDTSNISEDAKKEPAPADQKAETDGPEKSENPAENKPSEIKLKSNVTVPAKAVLQKEAPLLSETNAPESLTVHVTNILYINPRKPESSINGHAIAWENSMTLSKNQTKLASGFNSSVGGKNITANGFGYSYKFLNAFVLAEKDSGPVYSDTLDNLKTIKRIGLSKGNVTVEFNDGTKQSFENTGDVYISPIYKATENWYLEYKYIDNISTGSGSWSNRDAVVEYQHTFSDPSVKTPQSDYKFIEWRNEEDGKVFKAGDSFIYSGAEQKPGSTKTINIYAYWQPAVTVNYHQPGKETEPKKAFDEITVYDFKPEPEGSIQFDGWYSDKELTQRIPEETVEKAHEITKEAGTARVIDVYARYVTSKTVKKVWDDTNNRDRIRPANVQIQLTKNGEVSGEAVTLNAGNNWTYEFTNLTAYDKDGKLIDYSADEVNEPRGYRKSVTSEDDTITITNSHTLNPTPAPDDDDDPDPTPTSTPTPTYIPVPIIPTTPEPNPVVPAVVPQQGGNPRPAVVPANQPTPTPTASATPRPTPSATPTPTPAVIEEPEVPLARPGAWALINLICSILTCITGLGMGITYLRKHDEAIDEEEEEIRRAYVGDDEEEEEVNKRKASKFTGIIPAVGSVILFCLTEDMRLPMRLVDKWTIWMVLILLVNLLLAYLTRNRNNEKLYFNANGGVGYMEPVIQEAGKDAEVPEGEFVRSGYTFAGWNTEPDGSGDFYQPSDSFRMEKDQVNKLYAQWRA